MLGVTSVPHFETQHDFVVGELNPAGGIQPCFKTSTYQGAAEFTAFEEDPAGGISPCIKTMVGGGRTTFEQLDTDEAGGIAPCWVVGAERLADGSLGLVGVVVNDPALNFTVRVGARTYRLMGGALVEEGAR